jgi:hypothetical protein
MGGFAQVPAELLAASVSDRAKLLWAVLDIHQRDNGESWPGREHLSEELGCSTDSIERAAAELERVDWVEIEHRRGRGQTNRYRVLGRPGKGRTGAVISEEKAAPVRVEKAAPVRHRNRGREPETPRLVSRARRHVPRCANGYPIASDGECCPEHAGDAA